jgi:hypothetical protein
MQILHGNPLETLSQAAQPNEVDPNSAYRLDGINGGLDLFLGSSTRLFSSLDPVWGPSTSRLTELQGGGPVVICLRAPEPATAAGAPTVIGVQDQGLPAGHVVGSAGVLPLAIDEVHHQQLAGCAQ